MRKVIKDFADVPKDLQEAFNHKLATGDLKKQLTGYNAAMPQLMDIYHSKCAACEERIYTDVSDTFNTKGTVEHYRPKSTQKPIMVDFRTKKKWEGYYWLSHEWSNLLPMCKACNQKKADQFPLADQKKYQIDPPKNAAGDVIYTEFKANSHSCISEDPDLLHPEIDCPEDFLRVNKTGILEPLTGLSDRPKKRAETTIDLYSLNRNPLVFNRKKIIEDIFSWMEGILIGILKKDVPLIQRFFTFFIKSFNRYPQDKEDLLFLVFDQIKKIQTPEHELTMVGYCMDKYFEDVLLSPLCQSLSSKNSNITAEKIGKLKAWILNTLKKYKQQFPK